MVQEKKDQFKLTKEEIFKKLKTSQDGLSKESAKARLEKHGPNELLQEKTDSLFVIYLRQFKSPLIYLLLVAALVVFLIGEFTDGLVILFVIFFNSVVGTIQEGRSQNTLLALKRMTETTASVARDKREIIILDRELVPGDVIFLREGDKVPADAIIIESKSLKVDEAVLTGESFYRNKSEDISEEKNNLPTEQNNLVFKGTYIVSGTAKAVVAATGLETYIGKISKKASLIESDIPLKKDIAKLSKLIIISVLLVCALIIMAGIFRGSGLLEMIKFAISVAVSVIPEGLPIILTLVLATGVWRMSKNNVLVKRIQAVEALGQTKIIAVDKTGTLTKNQLSVQKIFCQDRFFRVAGGGYEPKGEVSLDGKTIDPLNHPDLLMAGKISALCANAQIAYLGETKSWKVSGDPVEAAMSVFSKKVGFHREILEEEMPITDEIPFNYTTKIHFSIHREKNGNFLSAAGAPENILKISKKIWHPDGEKIMTKDALSQLESVFYKMSAEGLRVIALAVSFPREKEFVKNALPEVAFVGFLGMRDVIRPEAREAVEKVQNAGIRVIMITGDHTITAKSVAEEVGIDCDKKEIITGDSLEKMEDVELADRIGNACVFARVTPEHKLRIIEAYKSRGETIAMTGDGVNDALSLVAADLGVAMGKIGTEVAKEASDIIILDDNFGSLVTGIKEGRSIFKTIKRVILYLFSTSVGELFTILATFAMGLPLPILAVQVLWLNLVTDGFLDVSLAMEARDGKSLLKKITKDSKILLDKLMIQRIIIMAAVMAAGTLFLFSKYYEGDIKKGWTISLTALAVFQWFNAWNCRSESKSLFKMSPFSNLYLVGATVVVVLLQCAALYVPFMQKMLHTVPLSFREWGIIISVSFLIIITEEIRKLIYKLITKNKKESHAQHSRKCFI